MQIIGLPDPEVRGPRADDDPQYVVFENEYWCQNTTSTIIHSAQKLPVLSSSAYIDGAWSLEFPIISKLLHTNQLHKIYKHILTI